MKVRRIQAAVILAVLLAARPGAAQRVTLAEANKLATPSQEAQVSIHSSEPACDGSQLLSLEAELSESLEPAANEGPSPAANPDKPSAIEPADRCRQISVPLRLATAYVLLDWNDLRYKVLLHEQETAARYARVEALRVAAGVDDGSQLVRARLLEARSRARAAHQQREIEELRESLAQLLGKENLEPVLDAVPPPHAGKVREAESVLSQTDPKALLRTRPLLEEVAARRDAVQLTYLLAVRKARRAAGLPTSTLGEQLDSTIQTDQAFVDLLDASADVERVELQLLDSSGQLQNWAERTGSTRQDRAPRLRAVSDHYSEGLLLLPAEEALKARESLQLAAVSTQVGRGKDVTTAVRWTSSDESVAIVSSSGLVTALRPGTVVISAARGDQDQEKQITVAPAEP